MGYSNGDVGGYRGRRTVTDILRWIAIVLAVIVVLVLAGVFYLQRYVVYTDEGPKLELPPFLQMFRREPGAPDASQPPPDVSVVMDPSGSADTSQSENPPDIVQKPSGYALQLTVNDVLSGTADAKLEEAGAEALILEMKAPSGKLAWYSDQFAAEWAEVNASKSNNDALKQWNDGDIYTIARLCCFRDDSLPYSMNNLALRRGEFNWRDELGLRWLSPAVEESQTYVASLCGELAALGFDEIVLEQFHFPVQGNVDNINRGDRYNPDRLTSDLENLLDQVAQALEPYDTKLSLWVEADTITGVETVSGVTPQLLEQYAYRVWVEGGGLTLPAGVTGGTDRMVSVTSTRTEDNAAAQAVIPER